MAATIWRAAEGLDVRPLDALTLVYHPASGQTHLLASPLPEILDLLAAKPLDSADVVARLGERFDLEGDAAQLIGERLDELAALGLVACA